MELNKIYTGDSLEVLRTFPDESVNCVITSPPYYGLRNYGVDGQIGLEDSPEEYVKRLTEVFMECHRILKANGTFWLNMGDSYAGSGRGKVILIAKAYSRKRVLSGIYSPSRTSSPAIKIKT